MSVMTSSKMLQKCLNDKGELADASEAKYPPPQPLTKFVDRSNSAESH